MERVNVVVGSTSNVKVRATARAFSRYYDASVKGIEVDSGVPAQPFGEQTFAGAVNRAKEAMRNCKADFAVGIEGGIKTIDKASFAFAAVCIIDKEGRASRATTGFFPIPEEAMKLINDGKELGEAMDMIYSEKDTKSRYGAVGLLTKGAIDRTSLYEHAIILALIPHINKELTWSLS